MLTVHLAWTGPPAQAPFTHTGWDTCPARWLSMFYSMLHGVLMYLTLAGHLNKVLVGLLQGT